MEELLLPLYNSLTWLPSQDDDSQEFTTVKVITEDRMYLVFVRIYRDVEDATNMTYIISSVHTLIEHSWTQTTEHPQFQPVLLRVDFDPAVHPLMRIKMRMLRRTVTLLDVYNWDMSQWFHYEYQIYSSEGVLLNTLTYRGSQE